MKLMRQRLPFPFSSSLSLCFVLCFSLSLLSFSSLAMSSHKHVGDHIRYESSALGYYIALEAGYTDYNEESEEIEQSFSLHFRKERLVQKSFFLNKNLVMTKIRATLMVTICESLGGVEEYLELPVGKTLSCRIDIRDTPQELYGEFYEQFKGLLDFSATLWLAPVPVTGVAQFKFAGQIVRAVDYTWSE